MTKLRYFLLVLLCFLLFTFRSNAQQVTSFVGSGTEGNENGVGANARFYYPYGIAKDKNGNFYLADTFNHLIRKITPNGTVSTLAGSGDVGSANGTGVSASFNRPYDVAVDATGNVFVADGYNHLIRKITPNGVVSTFAGSGVQGSSDGTGTAASFYRPRGLSIDASGNIYVADSYNNMIRKITPARLVSTFAGSGLEGNSNGSGSSASFYHPCDLAVDVSGNIFVADSDNNLIRKISSTRFVSTIAGNGTRDLIDGQGLESAFYIPYGITTDAIGNVYIGDSYNHSVRKINMEGKVSTIAGTGSYGFADGDGSQAKFKYPSGLVIDDAGDLYVADAYNYKVRRISLQPTGLNNDLTTSKLKLYPNPSTEAFVLEITETVQVQIYDLAGNEIETLLVKGNCKIGSEWPKGIYFIKIEGPTYVSNLKVRKD